LVRRRGGKAQESFRLQAGAHSLGDDPVPRRLSQPSRAYLSQADASGSRSLPRRDGAGSQRAPPRGGGARSDHGVLPRDRPRALRCIPSPGRLVWEKGHQDVMRAIAALRRGIVSSPDGAAPRLLVVGSGPEEKRLRAYARELGIGDAVDFQAVPYEEMPRVYAEASCLVLGSLPSAGCSIYLGDLPRCFWEEQFGLVFAEAMAAGLPIITTTSGAIAEVVGNSGDYFAPGDWMELAHRLAEGPLSRPPAERVQHLPERVRLYSTEAMAERLAAAYDRVLGG